MSSGLLSFEDPISKYVKPLLLPWFQAAPPGAYSGAREMKEAVMGTRGSRLDQGLEEGPCVPQSCCVTWNESPTISGPAVPQIVSGKSCLNLSKGNSGKGTESWGRSVPSPITSYCVMRQGELALRVNAISSHYEAQTAK